MIKTEFTFADQEQFLDVMNAIRTLLKWEFSEDDFDHIYESLDEEGILALSAGQRILDKKIKQFELVKDHYSNFDSIMRQYIEYRRGQLLTDQDVVEDRDPGPGRDIP